MARKTVTKYRVSHDIGGTSSVVVYYQGGGADTIADLPFAEAGSYDHERRRLSTGSPEVVGEEE